MAFVASAALDNVVTTTYSWECILTTLSFHRTCEAGERTMNVVEEIQPGDVVDYHGEAHCITRIEQRPGWSWAVAFDGTGWAVALGNDDSRSLDRRG
jgi:hypothetical protein